MDDPLDFALSADDRIHFAFTRDFCQIAAESLQGRGLDLTLLLRRGFFGAFAWAGFLLGSEVRIEFLQDFLAGLFDIDVEILEDAGGDAVALAEQA